MGFSGFLFRPVFRGQNRFVSLAGPSGSAMLGWENSLIDSSTAEAGILSQPTGWVYRLVVLHRVRIVPHIITPVNYGTMAVSISRVF